MTVDIKHVTNEVQAVQSMDSPVCQTTQFKQILIGTTWV